MKKFGGIFYVDINTIEDVDEGHDSKCMPRVEDMVEEVDCDDVEGVGVDGNTKSARVEYINEGHHEEMPIL